MKQRGTRPDHRHLQAPLTDCPTDSLGPSTAQYSTVQYTIKHTMADSTSAPATTTYRCSCHCGAFAYRITHKPLTDAACEVLKCNCSICVRNGYLFVYPRSEDVVFEKGSLEEMTVRLFPPFLSYLSNLLAPALALLYPARVVAVACLAIPSLSLSN